MGYVENPDGTLEITDDASDPVADLQKIADLAAKLGGVLRGATAVRTSLTASQTQTGWLFVETDTGIVFERRSSGTWERVTRATVGYRLTGNTSTDGTIAAVNPFAPSVPKWVQVSAHNNGNEALDKLLVPMVWTNPLGTGNVLLRFRRLDTNDWIGAGPVAAYVTFGLD